MVVWYHCNFSGWNRVDVCLIECDSTTTVSVISKIMHRKVITALTVFFSVHYSRHATDSLFFFFFFPVCNEASIVFKSILSAQFEIQTEMMGVYFCCNIHCYYTVFMPVTRIVSHAHVHTAATVSLAILATSDLSAGLPSKAPPGAKRAFSNEPISALPPASLSLLSSCETIDLISSTPMVLT